MKIPRRIAEPGKVLVQRIEDGSHQVEERYRSYRRHRDYHFIIYASARTGSTSLRRALDCYAGIHCAPGEPFNGHVLGNIRDRVSGLPSLKREVGHLWERYNGFKHIWRPDRSAFNDPAMDDYLLTSAANRIVFLSRRNVLQRIVSTRMSEQTGVWQLWQGDDRGRVLNHRYEPLDKAVIQADLAAERAASDRVKRRLDESGVFYLRLWYEDVFGTGSVEKGVDALGKVITFVTARPFRRASLNSDARVILNPVATKVNSLQTYELVPRIHEIDQQFGNDETGYLFR